MGEDVDINEVLFELILEHFNVHKNTLKSKKKTTKVIIARQVFVYVSREVTKDSFGFISSVLNRRSHSTCISLNRNMKVMLALRPRTKESTRLEKKIEKITETLKNLIKDEYINRGTICNDVIYRWREGRLTKGQSGGTSELIYRASIEESKVNTRGNRLRNRDD